MNKQKRKFMRYLLLGMTVALLVVCCVLGLVACGDGDDDNTPPPAQHTQHTMGEWETETPATCTEDGTKKRKCTGCEYAETDVIPASHSLGEWKTETPATCTVNGTKKRTCSNCEYAETDVILASHSLGDWQVKTPATCTEDGLKQKVCAKCDYKESQTIPATGHRYVNNVCENCYKKEFLFDSQEMHTALTHFIGYALSSQESALLGGALYNHYEEFPSEIPCYYFYLEIGTKSCTVFYFFSEQEAIDSKTFMDDYWGETFARIGKALVSESEDGLYTAICEASVPQGAIKEERLNFVLNAVTSSFTDANKLSYFAYALPNNFSLQSYSAVGTKPSAYMMVDNKSYISEFVDNWDGEPTENLGDPYTDSSYIRNRDGLYFADVSYKTGCLFEENDTGYAIIGYVYDANFTSLEIPSTYNGKPVTEIRERAFKNITCIKTLTVPKSIRTIAEDAFEGCTSLTTVNWNPENIFFISQNAVPIFSGCENIQTVNFGNEVITVPDSLLAGCTNLQSVVIPDNVAVIGYRAFKDCTNLKTVVFSQKLESIEAGAFENCTSLTEISLPDSLFEFRGVGAFSGCTGLTKITLPFIGLKKNPTGQEKRWLFAIFGNTVGTVPSSLKEVVLTGGETLNGSAFSDCSSLTSITLPDSLTEIKDYAFYGCSSLKSMDIPKNVTNTGTAIFSGCTALSHVNFLGDGVNIGFGAFEKCTGLKSVTIPKNATVQSGAFEDTVALEKVYFAGTADEWNSVTISTLTRDNKYLVSADKYYYSEEKPTDEGNYWHYVDGEITVWAKEN